MRISACLLLLLTSCTILRVSREVPRKTVVLTFDDGPNAHENTTERLLSVLEHHQVKAIFSLIGENADMHPHLVARIHASGHLLANHGYTDKTILFKPNSRIVSELQNCRNAIRRAVATDTVSIRFFRPAMGWYRPSARALWESEGMKLFTFSCHGWDAVRGPRQASAVALDVIQCVRDHGGGIVVLHDGRDSQRTLQKRVKKNPSSSYNRSWIPDVVDTIISVLKTEGYTFSVDIPF